ncbi:MAG: hypothetical protein K5978_00970 [Campylobacter sp.]|nr:hypothetical protein [Campylobacter sp.]
MQLLGHELVDFEPLNLIKNEDEICQNALFKFDKNLIKLAKQKGVKFSVICKKINEAIIANAVGASLIVCDKKLAKSFVKLAEFYIFDAKIACIISQDSQLDILAKLGVDTAIYQSAIFQKTL